MTRNGWSRSKATSRKISWTWSWPCAKPRGAATPCAIPRSSRASTRASKRPLTPSGGNEGTPLHIETPYLRAAILSAFLPGAGQLLNGHSVKAAEVLTLGIMVGAAWYFGYAFEGPFTPFLLYVFVPIVGAVCWARQVLDAYSSSSPGSLFPILPVPSRGSVDLQAIGFLFLLTALTDLYIIQARPDYGLKILGTTLPGVWGILAKAQSPTLHILIGVGFLLVKRWGLFVYLLYAGFGVINAGVNLAVLPGPHRSEEHTSELQSRLHLVCRLLLEKKKTYLLYV